MEERVTSAMSQEAIQQRVRQLFNQEIVVTTPSGPVIGICEGGEAEQTGGRWFWKRYRTTHLMMAKFSSGDGGSFGSRIPVEEILNIEPHRSSGA